MGPTLPRMQSLRKFFSTSFGSAVGGGLVVLIAGLILIQAGVVDTSKDSTSAPVIEPRGAGEAGQHLRARG